MAKDRNVKLPRDMSMALMKATQDVVNGKEQGRMVAHLWDCANSKGMFTRKVFYFVCDEELGRLVDAFIRQHYATVDSKESS